MKTRNGFVSNSSSTSFIVRNNQKEMAEKMGLRLFPVIELLNKLNEMKATLKWFQDTGMDFVIGYNIYQIDEAIAALDNLREHYISEPYDRDRAYENGIDIFSAFQEDL